MTEFLIREVSFVTGSVEWQINTCLHVQSFYWTVFNINIIFICVILQFGVISSY